MLLESLFAVKGRSMISAQSVLARPAGWLRGNRLLLTPTLLSLLMHLSGVAPAAADEPPKRIKVSLGLLQAPTAKQRERVHDWILDLETTTLLADRLAVVATGEYFVASGVKDMDIKRFAFCWAVEHQQDRERVVFGDSALNAPLNLEGPNARYVADTGSALDRLRVVDDFHEAINQQRRPVAKKSAIGKQLRLMGLFFPVTAASSVANEIYLGMARDPQKAKIDIKKLTGLYTSGSLTIAEFVSQWKRQYQIHRIVVFRNGLPVQVEDFLYFASGPDDLPALQAPEITQEAQERLADIRKGRRPRARTTVRWDAIHELKLPTELNSMMLSGPHDIEVEAKFMWLVNREIEDQWFQPDSVGLLGPLDLLAD